MLSYERSMSQFQKNLHTWFSRSVKGSSFQQSFDFSFVLGSDIGLVRKENQDRVGAIYTGASSINPVMVFAVADGMGGMRDGKECAILTLSSFFQAIVQHRELPLEQRASASIMYANEEVYNQVEGRGGSTLSAILIDGINSPVIAHVGDSRIYTYGSSSSVVRQTVDDSLAEAVGGSGRELLQFVGMGESMQPNIKTLEQHQSRCVITTDGIHNIENSTLYSILTNSVDIRQAAERLTALSRWCGGVDNATCAFIDMDQVTSNISNYKESGLRVWDAFGELMTQWIKAEQDPPIENMNIEEELSTTSSMRKKPSSSKKGSQKRKASSKKTTQEKKEDIQLEIEISSEEKDAGSKDGNEHNR